MQRKAILCSLFVVGAIVGCRDYQDTKTKERETARAAETKETRRGEVRDVDLGRSVDIYGGILDKSKSFGPNDTVYASVDLKGLTTGASVVATWKDAAGNVIQKDVFNVDASGTNHTKFELSDPAGLPAGDYVVEIAVSGGDSSVERFTVKSETQKDMMKNQPKPGEPTSDEMTQPSPSEETPKDASPAPGEPPY